MDILSLLVLVGIAILSSTIGVLVVWILNPSKTTTVEITFTKKEDEDNEQ